MQVHVELAWACWWSCWCLSAPLEAGPLRADVREQQNCCNVFTFPNGRWIPQQPDMLSHKVNCGSSQTLKHVPQWNHDMSIIISRIYTNLCKTCMQWFCCFSFHKPWYRDILLSPLLLKSWLGNFSDLTQVRCHKHAKHHLSWPPSPWSLSPRQRNHILSPADIGQHLFYNWCDHSTISTTMLQITAHTS